MGLVCARGRMAKSRPPEFNGPSEFRKLSFRQNLFVCTHWFQQVRANSVAGRRYVFFSTHHLHQYRMKSFSLFYDPAGVLDFCK